ncbi:hypothetical protein NDU88_005391 [Pleurodeles waltl]|uniref:Uncharacterized protein n=1 Tax=Pleurodeles waltl TaxID=8319 RepID=A0AAV7TX45_PLEWA|nr:hypothetical protein NDU88_005391 [Pleurodeles waltl]
MWWGSPWGPGGDCLGPSYEQTLEVGVAETSRHGSGRRVFCGPPCGALDQEKKGLSFARSVEHLTHCRWTELGPVEAPR